MPEKYKVLVSPKANRMLVEHAGFLAAASENAALQLISDFRESAQKLSQFPDRCPYLRHDLLPKHKYRKLLFGGRYLLLFRVIGDTVYVDYVVDCRQDYGWLVK
jgi:plasmid stabilization system protein ParE